MESLWPLTAPKGVGRVVAPDRLLFLAGLLRRPPLWRIGLIPRPLPAVPVAGVFLAARPGVAAVSPFRPPFVFLLLKGLPLAPVARRLLAVGTRLGVDGPVWPAPRTLVLVSPLVVAVLPRLVYTARQPAPYAAAVPRDLQWV